MVEGHPSGKKVSCKNFIMVETPYTRCFAVDITTFRRKENPSF